MVQIARSQRQGRHPHCSSAPSLQRGRGHSSAPCMGDQPWPSCSWTSGKG